MPSPSRSWQRLEEMPTFARELAAMFITELARLVSEVRGAASDGNWPSLQRAAHTLTGCASTLGFVGVAQSARAIEMLVRGGVIDETLVPEEVARLSAASDLADHAAREYLGEQP